MAVVLIDRKTQNKFGELMEKIRERYYVYINVYPKVLSSAYELIETHSGSKIKRYNYRGGDVGNGCGGKGRIYTKRKKLHRHGNALRIG